MLYFKSLFVYFSHALIQNHPDHQDQGLDLDQGPQWGNVLIVDQDQEVQEEDRIPVQDLGVDPDLQTTAEGEMTIAALGQGADHQCHQERDMLEIGMTLQQENA